MISNAKTVTVLYFAAIRDQTGKDAEQRRTSAPDAAALYAEVAREYGLQLPQSRLRAAINHCFCPWSQSVAEGDTVAFIPPVAGG